MKTPFTAEQFFSIFHDYNLAVWPMQIVMYCLAVGVIILALVKSSFSNRAISLILVFFWLWMGIVYHLMFFTAINKAAYGFGTIFIIQALIFLYYGMFNSKLAFRFPKGLYGYIGALLILYALVIYPLLGMIAGHTYPNSPTFGLPCPTTIFTFGLLLWTDKKFPIVVMIIPFLWSLLGTSAALQFGVKEDFGLVVSGISAFTLILIRDRQKKPINEIYN